MARPRYLSRVLRANFGAKFGAECRKLPNGATAKRKAARSMLRAGSSLLETRPGTPKVVVELGGLCELVLDLASVRIRTVKLLAGEDALKQDGLGDSAWSFEPRTVKLVGDGNGDLHIAGYYRPLPNALARGRSYFLGAVVRIDRRNDQGDLLTHSFATHGGEYPKLHYRDGYLFFRGGTYSITGRGIEG